MYLKLECTLKLKLYLHGKKVRHVFETIFDSISKGGCIIETRSTYI